MKKKIIFVQFVKFLDFHYDLFEIKYLKKNFDVEIHDLSYFFNKKSHEIYKYLEQKNETSKFYDLISWFNKIICEHKKFKNNLYIIYTEYPLNLKFLYYHFFLSKKKINIALINQNTMPNVNIMKDYSFRENLMYKLHRAVKRHRHVFFDKKKNIIKFVFDLISKINPPKYIFTNGLISTKRLKKKFYKSKIVSTNSWEASKIFIKEKKNNISKKNYGVYLTPFSINSATDSNTYGYHQLVNAQNVFKSVNIGLNQIEKKNKKKILIGLHPRGEDKIKRIKDLGNRLTYKNNTMSLIKNSKFVITHASIAISYAIIFNKPLIFIFTNEHKKDYLYMRYNKCLAEFFLTHAVNIEKVENLQLNNFINKKEKKKYKYFKKAYLFSKKYKNVPNYKIIKNLIYNSK